MSRAAPISRGPRARTSQDAESAAPIVDIAADPSLNLKVHWTLDHRLEPHVSNPINQSRVQMNLGRSRQLLQRPETIRESHARSTRLLLNRPARRLERVLLVAPSWGSPARLTSGTEARRPAALGKPGPDRPMSLPLGSCALFAMAGDKSRHNDQSPASRQRCARPVCIATASAHTASSPVTNATPTP